MAAKTIPVAHADVTCVLTYMSLRHNVLISNYFRRRHGHTEVTLITDGVQHRCFNHPLGLVDTGNFLKAYGYSKTV